jgi:hypothetical protein
VGESIRRNRGKTRNRGGGGFSLPARVDDNEDLVGKTRFLIEWREKDEQQESGYLEKKRAIILFIL